MLANAKAPHLLTFCAICVLGALLNPLLLFWAHILTVVEMENRAAQGDWGEEVIPGIHIIRRGPSAPSGPSDGEGVVRAPLSLQEAARQLQDVHARIEFLQQANEKMHDYLMDEADGDNEEEEEAAEREPDPDIIAAIAENDEALAKLDKERQELLAALHAPTS